MIGIFIAIFSAFALAVSQIVLKRGFKEFSPSVAFFFDVIFGILIWIPIGLAFGGSFNDLPQTIWYAIIGAILSEVLVFYALSKGNLSITSTILGTYPIYTLIFSIFINNEKITFLQIILILFIVVGSVLTSLEKAKNKKRGQIWNVAIPLLTALSIGFADTLSKTSINNTSSFSFLIAIAIVQVPVAIIYLIISKQNPFFELKKACKSFKEYKNPMIGSLFNIIGTGLLYISFNYTYAAIASPITASHVAFVVAYSLLVLKEKILKINIVGIIITIISLIIFSIITI